MSRHYPDICFTTCVTQYAKLFELNLE